MYNKVLVPLDGSPFAEQVLAHAAPLARQELHLISVAPLFNDRAMAVVDLYPVYMVRDYAVNQDEQLAQLTKDLEDYLCRVGEALHSDERLVVCAVRFGQPADEILAYAEETHCDLIAMSTHGRSGLGRWVYGSVADKVLRGAAVPVLLIRSQEAKPPAPAS